MSKKDMQEVNRMADRKKVIDGLFICLNFIDEQDCPESCPYFDKCQEYEGRVIFQPLMRDALALLKEQGNCENCAIAIEDRQPVVRCKDCKYSEHWYKDKRRCFLWCKSGIDVFEDGYCNYGKRRDDDA